MSHANTQMEVAHVVSHKTPGEVTLPVSLKQ